MYGYVRVGVAVPEVSIADPELNVKRMLDLVCEAEFSGVQVLCYPELGITAYTCKDLFLEMELQQAALHALYEFSQKVSTYEMIMIVGLPLMVEDKLFNVAVVLYGEKILACIPKTFIPNYKEFEETRWFAPASRLTSKEVVINKQQVPIGTDIIVDVPDIPGLRLGVEICEDLWMPIPPSSFHALRGATVLCNLSASNELRGKSVYRRSLVANQSARCVAAYAYTSCGPGESTSDVLFSGHSIIADNGEVVEESKWLKKDGDMFKPLCFADIDVARLVRERSVMGSFGQSAAELGVTRRVVICER